MKRRREKQNAQADAINSRLDFEEDLRRFAREQAGKLNQSMESLLSESSIAEILNKRPGTLSQLKALDSLRGDLPESFYLSLLATCAEQYEPEAEPLKHSWRSVRGEGAASHITITSPVPDSLLRNRTAIQSTDTLTPEQQALDQRLRDWRKAESEKLNLPLFFVLASTTLRSIVLARPQNLSQLRPSTASATRR
jgi:ATP-dependent DNA helicase RecQ